MTQSWPRPWRVLVATVALAWLSTDIQAGMRVPIAEQALSPLTTTSPAGSRLKVERVPLDDQMETLDLERFELWTADAEVVVISDGGEVRRQAPRDARFFRGRVGSDDDSMAFLGMVEGRVHGLVLKNERQFAIHREVFSGRNTPRQLVIEEVSPADVAAMGRGGFHCGVEGALSDHAAPLTLGKLRPSSDAALATGTASWVLNLAVETDYELFLNAGSSQANVETFIANLVGMASVIYRRDLQTEIRLSSLTINTSAADPFVVNPGSTGPWNSTTVNYTTFHALLELGDRWHNSPPSGNARSAVALISGKSQLSGVAWIQAICRSDFQCGTSVGCPAVEGGSNGHWGGAFSYNGGIDPPGDLSVPNPDGNVNYTVGSNYWPLLQLTHELGHNVQSRHTHCVSLSSADQSTYGRTYVDQCRSGEGSGCYSGGTSIPGEKGTLMSYCHLIGGGSQTRYTFGQAGEASYVIPANMKSAISAVTPALSSITTNPLTLNAGAAGTASVSNSAGVSYAWTISNGTINSGGATNAINYTAGTSGPVVLRVTATNNVGCSVTDTASVSVNTCVAPLITSISPSASVTLGSGVTLSAAASGAGPFTFQWYVGNAPDQSNPAAAGSSISVSPSATTNYWVRVTGACGSTNSGNVTVTVVTPPTTSSSFYLVAPCRVIDTRNAAGPSGGPAPAAGATRNVQVSGVCGVPSGAKAVSINVTAVAPPSNGWFTLYPGGTPLPGASTMNYRAGKTRANNAIVKLSAAGVLSVNNSGPGTVQFIIDINGYFN